MGQLFWDFESCLPRGVGVAPRPNMGTENWNFLKLLHDCGSSMVSSGSLVHYDTLFFEIGWKMRE